MNNLNDQIIAIVTAVISICLVIWYQPIEDIPEDISDDIPEDIRRNDEYVSLPITMVGLVIYALCIVKIICTAIRR